MELKNKIYLPIQKLLLYQRALVGKMYLFTKANNMEKLPSLAENIANSCHISPKVQEVLICSNLKANLLLVI